MPGPDSLAPESLAFPSDAARAYTPYAQPAAQTPVLDRSKITFSAFLSAFVTFAIYFAFVLSSGAFVHWFAIPILLCGVVIGADATKWVLGKIDVLDPIGILGLFGYHFFFLSPLLMIHWNYQLLYLQGQPEDYRPWLGGMASLNLLGLVIYRYSRNWMQRRAGSWRPVFWSAQTNRAVGILLLGLAVSGGIQVWVYYSYGGIYGYIDAYKEWVSGRDTFRGSGWLFSISESFPILAAMLLALVSKNMRARKTWTSLAIGLCVFFALQLFFGGLRGGRTNTIWGLFWAAGIVHFYMRKLPRSVVLVGICFVAAFMYLYGFYKESGLDAFRFFEGRESRQDLVRNSNRTAHLLLLSDFGRCGEQAFLLYRLVATPQYYKLALGQTYAGAAALLIGKSIWPQRPPGKVRWATEAEYGIGSYGVSWFQSSRVYGLAGEAMLNFGPWAAPLAFVFLGLAVGYTRTLVRTLLPGDVRRLILPFLILMCCSILMNDSDNLVFFLVKSGSVPIGLLILSASRRRQPYLDPGRSGDAGYLPFQTALAPRGQVV